MSDTKLENLKARNRYALQTTLLHAGVQSMLDLGVATNTVPTTLSTSLATEPKIYALVQKAFAANKERAAELRERKVLNLLGKSLSMSQICEQSGLPLNKVATIAKEMELEECQ